MSNRLSISQLLNYIAEQIEGTAVSDDPSFWDDLDTDGLPLRLAVEYEDQMDTLHSEKNELARRLQNQSRNLERSREDSERKGRRIKQKNYEIKQLQDELATAQLQQEGAEAEAERTNIMKNAFSKDLCDLSRELHHCTINLREVTTEKDALMHGSHKQSATISSLQGKLATANFKLANLREDLGEMWPDFIRLVVDVEYPLSAVAIPQDTIMIVDSHEEEAGWICHFGDVVVPIDSTQALPWAIPNPYKKLPDDRLDSYADHVKGMPVPIKEE